MSEDLNSASRKAYALTRAVAAIYRTLGADVEEEVSLAGNQIDLLVKLREPSGTVVRCVVECKAYSKLVGHPTLLAFVSLVNLLKGRDLLDQAILISINGFTRGLIVERADDIEHNSQILEVVQQRIRNSQLIVADTSTHRTQMSFMKSDMPMP